MQLSPPTRELGDVSSSMRKCHPKIKCCMFCLSAFGVVTHTAQSQPLVLSPVDATLANPRVPMVRSCPCLPDLTHAWRTCCSPNWSYSWRTRPRRAWRHSTAWGTWAWLDSGESRRSFTLLVRDLQVLFLLHLPECGVEDQKCTLLAPWCLLREPRCWEHPHAHAPVKEPAPCRELICCYELSLVCWHAVKDVEECLLLESAEISRLKPLGSMLVARRQLILWLHFDRVV
mmetsp:Transcript_9112/g.15904  ORF Transcript_9112/g.15904 Transcript_9112/m.15904 type:complete len:230 (-) Transcript_9112:1487-2176(-)